MSDVRVQILQVWWDDCDPETYRMQTKARSSRYRRGMLVFLRLGKLVVASGGHDSRGKQPLTISHLVVLEKDALIGLLRM